MYKKILVVLDERDTSQAAMVQGVQLAKVLRADVIFVYLSLSLPSSAFDTISVDTPLASEFKRQGNLQATDVLQQACDNAELAGVHSFRVICPEPGDAKTVSSLASRRNCDLIVVGVEGQSAILRILNRSIVSDLISCAEVPVLVCKVGGRHGSSLVAHKRVDPLARTHRNSPGRDDPSCEDND